MINRQIEKKLLGSKIIFPRYQDYCLSNLHQTIINLLTNRYSPPGLPADTMPKGKFSHIFLILIDALGYLSFKKNRHYFPLPQKTLISPLTTIFPSTTTAVLSTLSTGLLPQEHGLFEWRLYIPQIGDIIKTLPFCLTNSHQQDQLVSLGFNPEQVFFKKPTIYQKLAQKGIPSFAFSHQSYYKSAFAKTTLNGARLIPFTGLAELLTTLRQTTIKITNKYPKTFTYVYLDYLDSTGHRHGPESDHFKTELAQIALMIKQFFLQPLKENPQLKSKSLVIITADHGQVQINPKETIYLNRFRKLTNNLKLKPNQEPITATGGPRDVFLHLKKDQQDEVIAYLKKKLFSQADVYSSTEALKKGWFGNRQSSQKFLERLGEVLILPQDNLTVWLDNDEEKKIDKLGHHGGLTAEEMLVPLITIPL
jgi:predicted AlkP superfamily pyrophosphatase or phosphodiesterase